MGGTRSKVHKAAKPSFLLFMPPAGAHDTQPHHEQPNHCSKNAATAVAPITIVRDLGGRSGGQHLPPTRWPSPEVRQDAWALGRSG